MTIMKYLTTTIKGALTSAPLQISLGAALAFGFSHSALAAGEAQVCGPQMLQGTYALTAQGFNIVSGMAQPKAIIEGISFNGDGTLTVPFGTVSLNGLIIHIPAGGGGTYTLNSDCSGTLTFTSGPVNFDIVVQANGKEIAMIQTDSNTVFAGTAKRVSR